MKDGLSVVIPVYNEEKNILVLYNELFAVLTKLSLPYEIIFVNDGSFDRSLDQIKQLQKVNSRVKYISFAENYGQSAALKVGFEHVIYGTTVTMDADLQNDPEDIPGLLHYSGNYQVVNGWRKNRKDTIAKKIGSRVGNFIRNKLTFENINDTGCSLKIMDTVTLQKIKMYKGMHRFLPTLMKIEGAKVIEIPVNHRPRQHGYSKYTNVKRAFFGLYDLFSIRWMIKRAVKVEIKEKNV